MYDENNPFFKIINKELKCEEIYRDDKVVAFKDINPATPFHVLIVPCKPYVSFDDFTQNADDEYVAYFFKTIQRIAKKHNLIHKGYRIVTNTGSQAGQTVMHFHAHLMSGKKMEEEDIAS